MQNNSKQTIRPARSLKGTIRLPGDKSISHRYAMLGAIAEGDTRIENYSTGADCASTLSCVRDLGVEWESDGGKVVIHGKGLQLQAPKSPLDCGNSGSTPDSDGSRCSWPCRTRSRRAGSRARSCSRLGSTPTPARETAAICHDTGNKLV